MFNLDLVQDRLIKRKETIRKISLTNIKVVLYGVKKLRKSELLSTFFIIFSDPNFVPARARGEQRTRGNLRPSGDRVNEERKQDDDDKDEL